MTKLIVAVRNFAVAPNNTIRDRNVQNRDVGEGWYQDLWLERLLQTEYFRTNCQFVLILI